MDDNAQYLTVSALTKYIKYKFENSKKNIIYIF